MKKHLAILVAGILLLSGCTEAEHITTQASKALQDQIMNTLNINDPKVISVREGAFGNYPGKNIGIYFDDFFSDPTWKYFEADTGEEVIEFTGYCMFQEAEVKACLQFKLNEDETFEVGALSFNDIAQNQLMTAMLLTKIFEKELLEIQEQTEISQLQTAKTADPVKSFSGNVESYKATTRDFEGEWYIDPGNHFSITAVNADTVSFSAEGINTVSTHTGYIESEQAKLKVDGSLEFLRADEYDGSETGLRISLKNPSMITVEQIGMLTGYCGMRFSFDGEYLREEVSGAPDYILEADRIIASSTLPSKDNRYLPQNIIDYNNNTTWAEGVSGNGIGEWISLEWNTPKQIQSIEVHNGYKKSESTFLNNGRVKKMRIELSDGTKLEKLLSDGFDAQDYIDIGSVHNVTSIRFTILEVYKGTKYEDTCISNLIPIMTH